LLTLKKSGGFEKSLLILKNQADLRNPCVYRKTGGFVKSLRLQKNPAGAKNPAGQEK
jgi:hypothetical protein